MELCNVILLTSCSMFPQVKQLVFVVYSVTHLSILHDRGGWKRAIVWQLHTIQTLLILSNCYNTVDSGA